MFVPEYDITGVRPATYNPRAIAPDALEKLKHSIRTLGFVKPVIVTQDKLLIAGHQRTKAANALGLKTVPAWVIPTIRLADEIIFNQLHNGTDLDGIDHPVRVPPNPALGFCMVPASELECNMRSKGAPIRDRICQLISTYGNWGAAVATTEGEVISGQQYVVACKVMGITCRLNYISREVKEAADEAFKQQYGAFSYKHLDIPPYIQTYAQPKRLRAEEKSQASTVYTQLVMPVLKKHERLMDFGCGQGDHVRDLRNRGFHTRGVEFFYRNGDQIDTGRVHTLLDAFFEDLHTHGRFDVTLADAVINSVVDNQGESDVLTCLSAFCKPGGRIYFSTRSRECVEYVSNQLTKKSDNRRMLEFLDEDGYSGSFTHGEWWVQKFHTADQVLALGQKFFSSQAKANRLTGNYHQCVAVKEFELPEAEVEAAILREFNLPWPGGKSVGRGADALAAWRAAISKESRQG